MAVIKCPNCGALLEETDKFCFNCGTEIKKSETYKEENNIQNKRDFQDYKLKIDDFVSRINLNKYTNYIRNSDNKTMIKIAVSLMVIVVLIVICGNFTSNKNTSNNNGNIIEKNEEKTPFDWSKLLLEDMIPHIEMTYGDIIINKTNELKICLNEISLVDYESYVSECYDMGFSIEEDRENNLFNAFNKEGFKLCCEYKESASELVVAIEPPLNMNAFLWSDYRLLKYVPNILESQGKIIEESNHSLSIYIGNFTNSDYLTYIDDCVELGYDIGASITEFSYSAKNEDDYNISLIYHEYDVLELKIEEPVYYANISIVCDENLIFSQYDVKVFLDNQQIGFVNHGDSEEINVEIEKGTHNLTFKSADNDEVVGETELIYDGDENFKYKIHCYSDEISIQGFERLNVPYINGDLGEIKEDIVKTAFENLGYSNIEVTYLYDLSPSEIESNGVVTEIKIGNTTEFTADDKFYSNEKVTIICHSAQKIKVPDSSYDLKKLKQNEVTEKFKNAGFINVSTKIYDGTYSSSKRDGDIQNISINGEDWIIEGEEYPFDAEVIITYYSISYTKYQVSKLIDDLESNAYRAKENYKGAYVEITGRVSSVDSNGKEIILDPTNNSYSLYFINCELDSDQKDIAYSISEGDIITLRGKITYVFDLYYEFDVHSKVK